MINTWRTVPDVMTARKILDRSLDDDHSSPSKVYLKQSKEIMEQEE